MSEVPSVLRKENSSLTAIPKVFTSKVRSLCRSVPRVLSKALVSLAVPLKIPATPSGVIRSDPAPPVSVTPRSSSVVLESPAEPRNKEVSVNPILISLEPSEVSTCSKKKTVCNLCPKTSIATGFAATPASGFAAAPPWRRKYGPASTCSGTASLDPGTKNSRSTGPEVVLICNRMPSGLKLRSSLRPSARVSLALRSAATPSLVSRIAPDSIPAVTNVVLPSPSSRLTSETATIITGSPGTLSSLWNEKLPDKVCPRTVRAAFSPATETPALTATVMTTSRSSYPARAARRTISLVNGMFAS